MPDLAGFSVAALALLVLPGPAVLYVVSRSLESGRRGGLVSAIGIALGTMVHVMVVAIGLAAVLEASPATFRFLRWSGAAVLVALGWKAWKAAGNKSREIGHEQTVDLSVGRLLAEGALVNITNPKTALFFLAFLPQFARPDHGSMPVQLGALGFLFVSMALVTDSVYALAAHQLARRARSVVDSGLPDRVAAVVLLTLGLWAALSPS